MNHKFIYLNDSYITTDKAFISVHDRGFLFGDGIFETMKFIDSKICFFELHQQRLLHGLEDIKIKLSLVDLESKILKLTSLNMEDNCIIRISITRGIGSQGYMPNVSMPTLIIETKPLTNFDYKPKSLMISSYEKISQRALPIQSKLMQGLNSTLALIEARENFHFDAILLNANNELTEASSSNVFWLIDSVLHTPSLLSGILNGVTRRRLIRSCINTNEGRYNIPNICKAELIFLTNTVYDLIPVTKLFHKNNIIWESSLGDDKIEQIRREFVHIIS